MTKAKRGTAIVQTSQGILLTRIKGDRFLLPGGNTKPGEPRIITVIRELNEETRLSAESVTFLFDHESQHYRHKVFLVKASGSPKASNEIAALGYYPGVDPGLISQSSRDIIERFLASSKA